MNTQPLDPGGEVLGCKCPLGEGEDPGVDLCRAVEEQGPDHVEDHEQNQPRARGVGAEEARPAPFFCWIVFEADCSEHEYSDKHENRE